MSDTQLLHELSKLRALLSGGDPEAAAKGVLVLVMLESVWRLGRLGDDPAAVRADSLRILRAARNVTRRPAAV